MPVDDFESVAADITPAQLTKSVVRKRLRKTNTVTVGEKVTIKLEKRELSVGRRVKSRHKYDDLVAQAVGVLTSLEREDLACFLRRAVNFLQGGDPVEWARVSQSSEPSDRALYFLEQLERGEDDICEALRRNEPLCGAFQRWRNEANRIVVKAAWPAVRKEAEKTALRRKLNALRRSSRT